MATIRLWKVRGHEFAKELETVLNDNKGSKNIDIIADDKIFSVVVVNDDKSTTGAVDTVVNMLACPPESV